MKLIRTYPLAVPQNLCDVAEGGETNFPYQDTMVSPKRGTICLFPSGFSHPHEER